jgi:hypothetical protein
VSRVRDEPRPEGEAERAQDRELGKENRGMGIQPHPIKISRICKWLSSLFHRVAITDFRKTGIVPPQVSRSIYRPIGRPTGYIAPSN